MRVEAGDACGEDASGGDGETMSESVEVVELIDLSSADGLVFIVEEEPAEDIASTGVMP